MNGRRRPRTPLLDDRRPASSPRLAAALRPLRRTGAWNPEGALGILAGMFVWCLTRLLMLLAIFQVLPYAPAARVDNDVRLYAGWARRLQDGEVPFSDFLPTYPPGILAFLFIPAHTWQLYSLSFVGLAFACDFFVARLLRERRLGCWLWIVGLPLLGPVAWLRLDIFLTGMVLLGIHHFHLGRYGRCGFWLCFAALLKVWPIALTAVLCIRLPTLRARRVLCTAALATAAAFVLPLIALGGGSGLEALASLEASRGIEIEAVPSLPLHLLRQISVPVALDRSAGSVNISSDHSWAIMFLSTVCLAAGWLFLALVDPRRLPSTAVVALIGCCLTLCFAKILSPQFIVWLLGLMAASVDTVQRPRRCFLLTLFVAGMTQVLFPFQFAGLVWGSPLAVGVLGTRNALLLLLAGTLLVSEVRPRAPTGKPRGLTGRDMPGNQP